MIVDQVATCPECGCVQLMSETKGGVAGVRSCMWCSEAVVPGWAGGVRVAFVDQNYSRCTLAATEWLQGLDEKRQCPSCGVFVGPRDIVTDDEEWAYCCFACRSVVDEDGYSDAGLVYVKGGRRSEWSPEVMLCSNCSGPNFAADGDGAACPTCGYTGTVAAGPVGGF